MQQDVTKLSDAELLAIIGQTPAAAPQTPAQAPSRPRAASPAPAPLTGVQQRLEGLVPGVRITSARRSPERNKAVGGAPNSYHLRGQAFDLTPPQGMSMADLERQLRASGLPFAELINEGDHVHVAWNGEAVDAPRTAPAPVPGVESLSDEELLAAAGMVAPQETEGLDLARLARGDLGPADVEITRGLLRENGRVATLNQDGERVDLGSEAEWEALPPDQQQALFQQALNSRSAEYMAEYEAAKSGAENVPAWLTNLSQGNSLGVVGEAVAATNFLSPMTEGIDRSKAYEAARDAWRDRIGQLVQDDPLGSVGMQLAGGLLTPGLKGSGDWIGGATGASRIARAGAVGAGYGAVAGAAGSDEADLGSRVTGGLLGAGTGAATAGILDAGAQRAFAGASRRVDSPSPQRLLSREGVQLTPGQMLEPTPIIGGLLRKTEEAATSIPIAGPSIQAARTRGVESFNVAALNRALAPIGQRLPRDTRPGYDAVAEVQNRLGRAYDDVLPNISARLDQQVYDDIARVMTDAASEMPEDRLAQLGAVLRNRVFRNLEASDSAVTGEQFKRIESELGALARQYRTANDPAAIAFGEAVTGIQNAMREMIARQNPQQAARLRQINEGYANLVRIERAAGSSASQATDGVFSPAQLGVAVNVGTGRATRGRGGGLLQDLATAGRQVLPSTVNNSGTADRAGILALATGAGAVVNPTVTIPTIALTAGAYTKPAQNALNAIYRATDRRDAFSALGELERFAARNPALQPYYQAAVEHVQGFFGNQEQGQTPAATGLLSPTAR